MAFAHPEFLVSTEWLAEHLSDENVRLFEATTLLGFRDDGGGYLIDSGRPGYETGHIPGAGFLDLPEDFSDDEKNLRFMMPSAEAFADAAGRHGISESSKLVLYDRAGSHWAARFWWMFRSMGCSDVAVLDGGWSRWCAEGRAVSTEPATYTPVTFNPTADPSRFADLQEVNSFVAAGAEAGSCLINALGPEHHSGADEGKRYGRAGHIPGSINVPSAALLDPATERFRPAGELAQLFATAGVDRTQRAVVYCGGGIAASNDALILSMLGFEDIAIYDGSMSEYAADPARPLEVD